MYCENISEGGQRNFAVVLIGSNLPSLRSYHSRNVYLPLPLSLSLSSLCVAGKAKPHQWNMGGWDLLLYFCSYPAANNSVALSEI